MSNLAVQKVSFKDMVTSSKFQNNILSVLQNKSKTESFTTAVISAVSQNAMLQECTPKSIVSSALLGETLNLSPSPQLGHYYLVPFNSKNEGKQAQFQLGYKGYIQLAIRSGEYKKLNVSELKKGELIEFNPIDEEIKLNLINDYTERSVAETTGYYAFLEYHNGFKKAIYWSKEQMESHASKYSKAYQYDKSKGYKNSFWSKDFDEMAKKTMLRQLISKWGILSIEMQKALSEDIKADEVDEPINEPTEIPNTIVEEDTQMFEETEQINMTLDDF